MKGLARFWFGLPFIGRLLLTTCVALLLAGAAMLYITARQDAESIRISLQQELEKDLDTLPVALAETVLVGDFATLQQTLDRYVFRSRIVMAEFTDVGGTRLRSAVAVARTSAPGWFMDYFSISEVTGRTQVAVGGRVYGELVLTLDAQEPATRTWKKLRILLLLLLAAIGLIACGIWLVLRQGLTPLKRLEAATQALAAGRFDMRLSPDSNVEFQPIIESFNRMAEYVEASRQQLQESEELLRSSINTIGEAFVIYDPDDRLAFCNEEYRELYRASAPVIEVGRSFEEIIRYGVTHGQYKEAIGREESWIAERLATHRKSGVTLVQQLGDGRWLKIREGRTPTGHIVGFRVDVSDLFRAKEAAEAANIAKGRFLATMSHEIRTPMNGILGMAQLLLAPELDAAQRLEYARVILGSGQTLLALLNDILDLSKVESGRLELETSVFDPVLLLHEIHLLFAEAARRKGLRIECVWHGAHQCYAGDPHRLRQMISNLLGNAIKFTEQGEVRVDVREVDREGAFSVIEFCVADTGIGISEEKQSLLFHPFSQADSSISRQFGGTGLGLSIVRSMARLMGGDVGVESVAGQGARFWFRIRAERSDREARDRSGMVSASSSSVPAPVALQGHVLIVEDNPTNQLVIQALLKNLGVDYTLAENGQQGVDVVVGGLAADLILMDLQMPVLDGISATAAIRQWEERNGAPRRPIVALTADAYEADRKRCLAAGMDDFLAKPIDAEKLSAVLERWLGGHDAEARFDRSSRSGETAPAPVTDPAHAFDERVLMAQIGGDRDLARVLLQSALEDMPANFTRLEQAMAANDWPQAERSVHTMKGLAAQIGATRLSRRVSTANDQMKAGSRIDAAAVRELRAEYAILEARLRDWLGTDG